MAIWLVFVPLAVAGVCLAVVSVCFAAERTTVRGAHDRSYVVLVNPDGVMLYGKTAAWLNLYTSGPALLGLIRRLRGRTGWVVRVRPHPFNGYADLLHEMFSTRHAALARQAELARSIEAGQVLWPGEAEWFR